MRGLADRVAALGGHMDVRSEAGRGTSLVASSRAGREVLLREGLARLFADGGHEVVAAVGGADRMPPRFSDEGIRAAHWIRGAHTRPRASR